MQNWFHVKLTEWFFQYCVHTVEITEIYSHWKKILSNQLFSNFFIKNVPFTKCLQKKSGSKLPPLQNIFVKSIYSITFYWKKY